MKTKFLDHQNSEDLGLMVSFFKNEKNKSENFRYFDSRPFEIIENHLVTILFILEDDIVGYGHLDVEDDVVWLGIIVSENYRGIGYGKKIIEELIKHYDGDIQLSVDKHNQNAINLYKKFNFSIFRENKSNFIMKLIK